MTNLKEPDPDNLTSSQDSQAVLYADYSEISLVDVCRFLKRHFWGIGGTTIASGLLGVVYGMMQPVEFHRSILLNVDLSPSLAKLISGDTDTVLREVQLVAIPTLESHFEQHLEAQDQRPKVYGLVSSVRSDVGDVSSEYLRIDMRSVSQDAIENLHEASYTKLQSQFARTLDKLISQRIALLDDSIQKAEARITLLESRSAAPVVPEGASQADGLLSTLLQEQQYQSLLDELKVVSDLRLSRDELQALRSGDLTKEFIFEDVLNDLQEMQPSLFRIALLAAISGFIISVLVAVLIDQLPKMREALSKP